MGRMEDISPPSSPEQPSVSPRARQLLTVVRQRSRQGRWTRGIDGGTDGGLSQQGTRKEQERDDDVELGEGWPQMLPFTFQVHVRRAPILFVQISKANRGYNATWRKAEARRRRGAERRKRGRGGGEVTRQVTRRVEQTGGRVSRGGKRKLRPVIFILFILFVPISASPRRCHRRRPLPPRARRLPPSPRPPSPSPPCCSGPPRGRRQQLR